MVSDLITREVPKGTTPTERREQQRRESFKGDDGFQKFTAERKFFEEGAALLPESVSRSKPDVLTPTKTLIADTQQEALKTIQLQETIPGGRIVSPGETIKLTEPQIKTREFSQIVSKTQEPTGLEKLKQFSPIKVEERQFVNPFFNIREESQIFRSDLLIQDIKESVGVQEVPTISKKEEVSGLFSGFSNKIFIKEGTDPSVILHEFTHLTDPFTKTTAFGLLKLKEGQYPKGTLEQVRKDYNLKREGRKTLNPLTGQFESTLPEFDTFLKQYKEGEQTAEALALYAQNFPDEINREILSQRGVEGVRGGSKTAELLVDKFFKPEEKFITKQQTVINTGFLQDIGVAIKEKISKKEEVKQPIDFDFAATTIDSGRIVSPGETMELQTTKPRTLEFAKTIPVLEKEELFAELKEIPQKRFETGLKGLVEDVQIDIRKKQQPALEFFTEIKGRELERRGLIRESIGFAVKEETVTPEQIKAEQQRFEELKPILTLEETPGAIIAGSALAFSGVAEGGFNVAGALLQPVETVRTILQEPAGLVTAPIKRIIQEPISGAASLGTEAFLFGKVGKAVKKVAKPQVVSKAKSFLLDETSRIDVLRKKIPSEKQPFKAPKPTEKIFVPDKVSKIEITKPGEIVSTIETLELKRKAPGFDVPEISRLRPVVDPLFKVSKQRQTVLVGKATPIQEAAFLKQIGIKEIKGTVTTFERAGQLSGQRRLSFKPLSEGELRLLQRQADIRIKPEFQRTITEFKPPTRPKQSIVGLLTFKGKKGQVGGLRLDFDRPFKQLGTKFKVERFKTELTPLERVKKPVSRDIPLFIQPKFGEISKTSIGLEPITAQKPVSKLIDAQEPIFKQIIQPKEIAVPKFDILQPTKEQPAQKEKGISLSITETIFETPKRVTRVSRPKRPTQFEKPKKPTRPIIPFTLPDKGKDLFAKPMQKKEIGYDTIIKEKGRLTKANIKGLPRSEAKRLLKDVLENSLSASGRITKKKTKVPASRRSRLATGSFNEKNFRKGKTTKTQEFTVEKRGARLNSPGEIAGITAAKLLRSRKKQLKKALF